MNKLGVLSTVVQTSAKSSGAVIFLHGSGDTGSGVKQWVNMAFGKEFSFPHAQVYYPTAPLVPYTPLEDELSTVWFNRRDIKPDVPEIKESVDSSCKLLEDFIKMDVCKSCPLNRIVLGGFSMGGAMAMHLAFRYLPQVAGVFTISSFLNYESLVYDKLSTDSSSMPMLMCHGDRDSLVPIEWGRQTFKHLTEFGIKAEFFPVKYKMHELKKVELNKLHQWIMAVLPPLHTQS